MLELARRFPFKIQAIARIDSCNDVIVHPLVKFVLILFSYAR